MVAATKKRGRPRKDYFEERDPEGIDPEQSRRVNQNNFYVEEVGLFVSDIEEFNPPLYDFFVSGRGYKHRGILEQLGRMIYEGTLAGEDQVYQILKACMKAHNLGLPCKDIEKRLRLIRINGGFKRFKEIGIIERSGKA